MGSTPTRPKRPTKSRKKLDRPGEFRLTPLAADLGPESGSATWPEVYFSRLCFLHLSFLHSSFSHQYGNAHRNTSYNITTPERGTAGAEDPAGRVDEGAKEMSEA